MLIFPIHDFVCHGVDVLMASTIVDFSHRLVGGNRSVIQRITGEDFGARQGRRKSVVQGFIIEQF